MKRKKFKLIFNIFFFSIVILIIIFNKEITTYIVSNYIYNKNATTELKRNEYALNKDYHFVQITDDFIAQDYQHLLNIFYTILDSGEKEFYFYCSEDYKNCTKDIDKLIPDSLDNQKETDVLADINNLVHPYNSYESLTVVMNNYGKITIKVNKQYSNSDINYINNSIQEIEKNIIKDNMTLEDKIKSFHDYIINNTKYDKDRASNLDNEKHTNSESHTAIGLLKNHLSLCGGYSDIMSIYLHRHNIQSIRISAAKHVWNLVYINNQWLHLDATWDDPVTSTGAQILIHDYYLIDTNTLHNYDAIEHNYNKDIYKEAK